MDSCNSERQFQLPLDSANKSEDRGSSRERASFNKSAGQTGRWEDYCHEGSLSLRVISSSFYAREGGGGGGTEVTDNCTSGRQ